MTDVVTVLVGEGDRGDANEAHEADEVGRSIAAAVVAAAVTVGVDANDCREPV